ncbi:hypothetical protein GQ43DRAFT_122267 [Delitschia confertaspora ATCC 74209]|uniref:Uncharacterized protein n=1 Tax=Delitschia confertaspora ATCC 74209 TaxID=1513339 RepID=A0A9P4JUS8_9PLEO|nr:hypothetical protein GQ43DRAFT_122267 [Delitschia confertaspora ATCC 74209]
MSLESFRPQILGKDPVRNPQRKARCSLQAVDCPSLSIFSLRRQSFQFSLPLCSLLSALLHSALCTLHSALCTLHSALCTLHSAPPSAAPCTLLVSASLSSSATVAVCAVERCKCDIFLALGTLQGFLLFSHVRSRSGRVTGAC